MPHTISLGGRTPSSKYERTTLFAQDDGSAMEPCYMIGVVSGTQFPMQKAYTPGESTMSSREEFERSLLTRRPLAIGVTLQVGYQGLFEILIKNEGYARVGLYFQFPYQERCSVKDNADSQYC